MTPPRDPRELLRESSRALAELGARPAGDAADLLALSRSVRQEAETVAALADRSGRSPRRWSSRAAARGA